MRARRGRMRICQQCFYRRGDGACSCRRAVQLRGGPLVRPIDAPKSCASWRSDEFGINATRNRCEVCTCDLRLGTSCSSWGGSGFSRSHRLLSYHNNATFVVNNARVVNTSRVDRRPRRRRRREEHPAAAHLAAEASAAAVGRRGADRNLQRRLRASARRGGRRRTRRTRRRRTRDSLGYTRSPSADVGVHLPSRWSMRLPFVTFIIRVPVGRSASARDDVARRAIMSLLMRAISAVGPARV